MNKDNAHLYLPLVQALAEGKTIQYRHEEAAAWEDCGSLDFVDDPECYRIKPEPREFDLWITFHHNGQPCSATNSDMSAWIDQGWHKIRVREIVE